MELVQTADPEPAALEQPAEPEPLTFKDFLAQLRPTDWIVLVCLCALYAPMFMGLWTEWMIPEAPQAYGLLVLPAALMLAWMLRSRVNGLMPRPAFGGFVLTGLGLLLTLLGSVTNSLTLSAFGFCAAASGIVWARYGTVLLKKFAFPLAFLLALIPMPHEFMNLSTFQLQQLSVRWAGKILAIFGDVSIEGTRVHMTNYTLDVIAPCSGMTIILPLITLAAYYLYLISAPLWKKVLLFALTIPVALVVNAVRISLIGVVGETISGKAAAAFHDYSGLITVVLGFATLIFIAQEMRCNRISDEIVL